MSVAEATRLIGQRRRLHFMGIGGAGMCALAEILLDRGLVVTGCDLRPGAAAPHLTALGAQIHTGHSPDHLHPDDGVVVSSAIQAQEPEVVAARERGHPIVRRAEMLGALMTGSPGIAVAGTHGKSTTTAMIGAVLEAAGWDPTVMVGGRMRDRGGNVRIGRGEWLVAEADEFDRSFLALSPRHAVVTNVEVDHLDTYGTPQAYRAAFAEFVGQVTAGGVVVVGADDPGARSLPISDGIRRTTFGLGEHADVRATDLLDGEMESRFTLVLAGEPAGEVVLGLPGRHNVRNALAAAAIGWALDVDPGAIRDGLTRVRGIERRFEIVRTGVDLTIIDDYAHHPTEVEAALATARRSFPGRRLVAVFQPHLYSRTRDLAEEFGRSLAAADVVFVMPIYPAREAPIPGVTAELVSRAARAAGAAEVIDLGEADEARLVAARLAPGDVVVTMGAGDIDLLAPRLAAQTEEGR
ncbi:MAG TPA: UDP-N-acetylmuramate--L-alanine ligase [Gemmatimonadota bacterium]|nr:UDP-N-acetylmuramate--L-alanine ligase [Gemmatimonadota bacterium]